MKIIVMDCANARIDVLNVPENMVGEDVELFLVEHDYSLNKISWMAVPADYVPVQFHEFGIDEENGKEVHEQRETKLKNFSIYDSVFWSFTRCSLTVIAAMRINLKHSDVYFRKP